MKKKKLPEISIQKVPNGYILKAGESETLHYTVQQLVDGFMYHVGLDIAKYADRETISSLLTACSTWPKEGDAIMAVAKLEAECETLRRTRDSDTKTIRELREKNAKMYDELTTCKQRLARFMAPDPKPKRDGEKAASTMTTLKGDAKKLEQKHVTRFEADASAKKHIKVYAEGEKKTDGGQIIVPYSEQAYKAVMTKIKDSGLPTRVMSVISMAGGHKNKLMGDVLQLTKADLMEVRGCGKFVLTKFDEWLVKNGVKLNMDVASILAAHAEKIMKKK